MGAWEHNIGVKPGTLRAKRGGGGRAGMRAGGLSAAGGESGGGSVTTRRQERGDDEGEGRERWEAFSCCGRPCATVALAVQCPAWAS